MTSEIVDIFDVQIDALEQFDVVAEQSEVNLEPLTITENGVYTPQGSATGFSKVEANVLPKSTDIVITENGEYYPNDYEVDAFSKVNVEVQPTLEELTITENGTYTPQEGVDGFSKVTAQLEPTRIKLAGGLSVTSNCIDENGYWPAEMIDTSNVTNMSSMFNKCSELRQLDVSKWDTSNVTSIMRMFGNCSSLQQLDVSNWDVSSVTALYDVFSNCSSLQQLDVSNWDVSSVTNIASIFRGCSLLQQLDVSKWDVSSVNSMMLMFADCSSLQQLDLSNWDVSSVNSTINMLSKCSSLQSIIGNRTIDDVLANNIGALNGLKVALSLNNTILDRASLRAVINGLADLTGQTPQTLTIGATLMAKLTEEDIAIATNKNWTIV